MIKLFEEFINEKRNEIRFPSGSYFGFPDEQSYEIVEKDVKKLNDKLIPELKKFAKKYIAFETDYNGDNFKIADDKQVHNYILNKIMPEVSDMFKQHNIVIDIKNPEIESFTEKGMGISGPMRSPASVYYIFNGRSNDNTVPIVRFRIQLNLTRKDEETETNTWCSYKIRDAWFNLNM